MISQEKWMILKPLQKLPNNVCNLVKIIVATGFEWLPKGQKIAQSGHTVWSTATEDIFLSTSLWRGMNLFIDRKLGKRCFNPVRNCAWGKLIISFRLAYLHLKNLTLALYDC